MNSRHVGMKRTKLNKTLTRCSMSMRDANLINDTSFIITGNSC